jgi:hypothetical protein
MSSKRRFFFLVSGLLLTIVNVNFAQVKEIKSNSDLPALHFSTKTLHPEDSLSIEVWMIKMAEMELPHIDSILRNFKISNMQLRITLNADRQLCNFITRNWKDLKNADTLFKQIKVMPAFIRQTGLAEFASYASVELEAAPDFRHDYISFLKEYLQPLSEEDRAKAFSSMLGRIGNLTKSFDKEMTKIKGQSEFIDTSAGLISAYAYWVLNTKVRNLLLQYANKMVLDKYTKADTLRGTIGPERSWWDVLRYDITVKPDLATKTISGKNYLRYRVVSNDHPLMMQIDLQEPLLIDSIFFNQSEKLSFTNEGNAWHVSVPKQKMGVINNLLIYYHGKVHEAINPPWDGGWSWNKDKLGNPWMEVTCQGKGASVWYPCKDHQSDEPDSGASLSMIIPDSLMGVSNGRAISTVKNGDGTTTYTWAVVNTINNYLIIPYVGKYVHFSDHYNGEKGNLDLNYWVMDYNIEKAKAFLIPEVKKMLQAHEYWFGPYPFYEDGYKLVEAPAGMEHQSAIAYSNGYQLGSEGSDWSGSGWGLKWDYIIVHESGHEWFGNNITTKDIADMWVHEGFGCYSETLYTEYWYGKDAGNAYNYGLRSSIENNYPVIGYYGVNDDISARNQDMYFKGANLIHSIRHSMDNDSSFRLILRGMNKTFYHQTVTSAQIEHYISTQSGYDYGKVFDQYLRNPDIPNLEFYFSPDKKKIFYRYVNCIDGFNLPLVLKNGDLKIRIVPTNEWNSRTLSLDETALFDQSAIEKMYYIGVKEVYGKQ